MFIACGSDDPKRKAMPEDAGAAGQAGEATGGAPQSAGGQGGAPESLSGAGGMTQVLAGAAGESVSGAAGAGGQPQPLTETVVAANVSLSTDSLTEGRACAEASAYSVVALSGSTVTLAEIPGADCLAPGDEALLINLQGTPTEHNNVGHWELVSIASLTEADVQLAAPIARFYGSGVSNTGLGVTGATQRVALVRVPRFERLVVEAGATITAAPWNGVLGGVVALRATELELSGTISAAALGYRAGRWSQDDITCSDSTQTEAGESIGGTGTATTLRNLGASGGIGPGSTSFNGDNPVVSSPGHAEAGQLGFNPNGRTIGEVGAAYGNPDATTLTMGSGPGGGLSCVATPTGPSPYLFSTTGQAGGIALLLVDALNVTATGTISATPPNSTRDVAYAGGYVFIHGSSLALGEGQVTARGSTGARPSGPFAGQTNRAGSGYVVVSAPSVLGTTDPPALTAAASPAPGL